MDNHLLNCWRLWLRMLSLHQGWWEMRIMMTNCSILKIMIWRAVTPPPRLRRKESATFFHFFFSFLLTCFGNQFCSPVVCAIFKQFNQYPLMKLPNSVLWPSAKMALSWIVFYPSIQSSTSRWINLVLPPLGPKSQYWRDRIWNNRNQNLFNCQC